MALENKVFLNCDYHTRQGHINMVFCAEVSSLAVLLGIIERKPKSTNAKLSLQSFAVLLCIKQNPSKALPNCFLIMLVYFTSKVLLQ